MRHVLLLAAALWSAPALADQPYRGEERRTIAALSADDVTALLEGNGWGFAKPAELNGFPGPRHVLDHAKALALTADQHAAITAIHAAMKDEAQRLGAKMVAAETALDAAFEGATVDRATLPALVAEAGRLRAALRTTHLIAHLETTPLLTRHQRHLYQNLRGYGDNTDDHQGHGKH